MKITIEIAEQEIAEEVKALIIQNAVLNIENDIYATPCRYLLVLPLILLLLNRISRVQLCATP